jgi:hypothetical protein
VSTPAGTPRRRIIVPQKDWNLSGLLNNPAVIGERMKNQSMLGQHLFTGVLEWENLPDL